MAIIHPNNFPLEPNQLAHHQISSAAVVLHTVTSIGTTLSFHRRAGCRPCCVTKNKTKKHELLSLRRPALPRSEKNKVFKRVHVYGGCTLMVSMVVLPPLASPPPHSVALCVDTEI
jgi:hypothetical protein